MDKKGVHLARYLRYFLFLLAIAITIMFLKTEPTITGYVIYQEETLEKIWDFSSPSEYIYNNSLINLSDQEVKLIPEIVTYNWTTEEITELVPTSAFLDHNFLGRHNKTSEIQTQDGDFVFLNKNNALLDVTFETPLDNGDIISLYILQRHIGETDIHLCDETTFCDPPGYGLVHFNGDEGWYNITLSNLPSSKDILAIDPPNPVKIDYIKATHIEYEQHSSTNITYPSTAEIETSDFEPDNWYAWGDFSKDEELNEQSIQYQYSTNSGNSWEDIPENNDLSPINSSKIRIKAILNSDGTETPALNSLTLTYITQTCIENWSCTDWSPGICPENEIQTRTCTDLHECGTEENKPNEAQSCICTPNPTNTSWSNWIDIEECQANDLKLQQKSLIQYDSNNCEEIENLTFTEQQYITCDYCSLHNCTDSFEDVISSNGNDIVTIDALNKTSTFLEINTTNNIESATVSIIKYDWTLQNNFSAGNVPVNKYLEIESNIADITSVKIIVYYTDEEINIANINENTLKISYYNCSSKEWETLDSVVNASGNYVYAIISHLSLYGLFGEEKTSAEESSSSSGGGDGDSGGGVRKFTEEKKEITTPETPLTESEDLTLSKETLASEAVCDHILEVSLPPIISFLKQDSYEGEIINKGNCDIQELNIYPSPELSSFISLSPATIVNLASKNKSKFQIIRRTEQRKWPFSFFTSSIIAEKMMAKQVSGTVTIEGMEEKESLFTKDLPIDIEVLAPEKMIWTIKLALPGTGFVTLLIILTLVLFKRKKRKKIKIRKNL